MTVYATFIAPVVLFSDQLSSINFALGLRDKNVYPILRYIAFIFILTPAFLNWKHMFKALNKLKSKTPEARL